MYLDAKFTFICDICLNGKSQVPEEFYIGSNPDEDIVSIPNRELYQLQADVHHLHDENLALTMVIQNGSHERVQPLKAPMIAVIKLRKANINCYIASFKKTVYAGRYGRKIDLCTNIVDRVDLVSDRRDDEATFINTCCLQEIIVTANYNSRGGSLNGDDKGVALRPDARPKSHHDELPDQPGITNDYPI